MATKTKKKSTKKSKVKFTNVWFESEYKKGNLSYNDSIAMDMAYKCAVSVADTLDDNARGIFKTALSDL